MCAHTIPPNFTNGKTQKLNAAMFRRWIDESERDRWEKDFQDNSVMSVRQWLAAMAVMIIPGVNVVMLFLWAFASKELMPANKVNWARACVILLAMTVMAIAIVGGFLLMGWKIHNS